MPKECVFDCPNCGTKEEFVEPREKQVESTFDFLAFGLVIASILYWFDWAGRVECVKCGLIMKKSKVRRGMRGKR